MKNGFQIAIASLASVFLLGATDNDEAVEMSPVEMAASCDAGVIESCANLGQKYYYGNGVSRNRTLANKLFSRACDKQHAAACAVLAKSYLNGDGVRQNYNIAFVAADRACVLNDERRSVASACGVKAQILSKGLGRAPDYSQAYAYLNQSCEMGEQNTCVTLAKSLRLGRLADSNGTFPITRDLVKARILANTACTQNSASGCYELAQLSSRTSSEYAKHIARSCDLGSGGSCFELAKAMDVGSAESNLAAGVRSLEHYRSEACRLNTRTACSWKSRATLAREERERREREAALARKKAAEEKKRLAAADRNRREAQATRRAMGRLLSGLLGPSSSRSNPTSRSPAATPQTKTFSCKTICASSLLGRKDVSVTVTARSRDEAKRYVSNNQDKICRDAKLGSYNVFPTISCK